MPRRVFITAAEVSGDQHAAHLIHSLKQLDPDLIIEGHGGSQMRAAGARLHFEIVKKAAIGVKGLGRVIEMSRLVKWTRNYWQTTPPDLQICVDSPALNFHFAKAAHALDIPVLYYIAPQLWAWREGRMKKLRNWVNRVACILPFEEEYFRRHGVDATFVGHPLFDELPPLEHRNGPRFPDAPPVIGIVPGSRTGEVNSNLEHLLVVARKILTEFPKAKFLIPTTPATDSIVRPQLTAFDGVITAKQDAFDEFIPRCDFCLCKSGTSTLHVAAYGVPMVVVYRVSKYMWHFFGKWVIKARTYSLVNILADSHEHVVPEFIPWYGSEDGVADAAIDFLKHPEKMRRQAHQLERVIRSLNKPGASLNVAKLAVEMMDRKTLATGSGAA